nr:retrovirus-related Pol polyprotein from transposon TNT 1-94 [Tanacetum cinerariifolium]
MGKVPTEMELILEHTQQDANHAGCQDSRRNTSRSAQFLGDRLVRWSSKKQRSTTISTTEAEYIAMLQTKQAIARDEGWVAAAERVMISPTNVRLETTVKQKEETFQVVIDVKDSDSYEFLLANKECVVNVVVFRKILDICPRKKGEDFTEVPNDDDTLTFLVGLGYPGPLHKYMNMFVDHMHQPWRTLATCINKCLSGKTASNDKLKKSRIDILWGMFYRENVDYPSLIWEDIAYQINHRREKKSRRENMPYPWFTKQYGLAIPATMLNIDIIKSESYQRFLLYSTGLIPPKKSRGKGSQGKKTADTTEENVEVTEESDPEPLIRKKTSSAAREVHAAHEKIVSEAVLEPTRRRQTWVTFRDTSSISKKKTPDPCKKLKGVLTLTPAEQEAADIMEALKESRKTSVRQSSTGGSDEGTGVIPGVLDESTVVFTTSSEGPGTKPGVLDDEEIIHEEGADETREHSYKIKVRKDADIEMKDAEIVQQEIKEKEELTDAEKTAYVTKEITKQPLTSSSLSVSSDYGTQFLNLSQDEETSKKPPITSTTSELQQTIPTPTTIPTLPINTEASSIPKITSLIAVQLRVAKLEQDVFELKKTDHSALERYTIDLIEKYFGLPASESKKKRESKKSTEEIIIIKWEQDEKKQMSTYTVKSTDKAALKEFNLKSALFKAMHENKSANRNPTNYRLYHAMMKSFIEDENAMDKDVSDTVKDHKRKHDSDDDDDDDNEGRSVSMDEQPTEDIPSPGDMHVSDPEDTDNAHIPKFQMEEFHKLLIDQVDLVNPEKITPFLYKPRVVIYKDMNEQKKMMRINKVHKFSDGTLTRIRDKLDFMVKDFKLFEYNKGMESRIWFAGDKRRSEEFIEVIEKRLKIKRISRSLECFVGGQLRDID